MHRTIFCIPELEEQLRPVIEDLQLIAEWANLDFDIVLQPSTLVPEGEIYIADMAALQESLFPIKEQQPQVLPGWYEIWMLGGLINRPNSAFSLIVS